MVDILRAQCEPRLKTRQASIPRTQENETRYGKNEFYWNA